MIISYSVPQLCSPASFLPSLSIFLPLSVYHWYVPRNDSRLFITMLTILPFDNIPFPRLEPDQFVLRQG